MAFNRPTIEHLVATIMTDEKGAGDAKSIPIPAALSIINDMNKLMNDAEISQHQIAKDFKTDHYRGYFIAKPILSPAEENRYHQKIQEQTSEFLINAFRLIEKLDFNLWTMGHVAVMRRLYETTLKFMQAAKESEKTLYHACFLAVAMQLAKYHLFRAKALENVAIRDAAILHEAKLKKLIQEAQNSLQVAVKEAKDQKPHHDALNKLRKEYDLFREAIFERIRAHSKDAGATAYLEYLKSSNIRENADRHRDWLIDVLSAAYFLKGFKTNLPQSLIHDEFKQCMGTVYTLLQLPYLQLNSQESALNQVFNLVEVKETTVQGKIAKQALEFKTNYATGEALNPTQAKPVEKASWHDWVIKPTINQNEFKDTQFVLDEKLFSQSGVGFVVFNASTVIEVEHQINLILCKLKEYDIEPRKLGLMDVNTDFEMVSLGTEFKHESIGDEESPKTAIQFVSVKDKLIAGRAAILFRVSSEQIEKTRGALAQVFITDFKMNYNEKISPKDYLLTLIQQAKTEEDFKAIENMITIGNPVTQDVVDATLDAEGNSALVLILCVRGDHAAIAQRIAIKMIENKVNILAKHHRGASVLSLAAWTGNLILCQKVITELKAHPDEIKKTVNQAFLDAWNPAVLNLLLLNGADRTLTDEFGNNKLHQAVCYGMPDVAKCLLDTASDAEKKSLMTAKLKTRLNYSLYNEDKGPQIGDTAFHAALKMALDTSSKTEANPKVKQMVKILFPHSADALSEKDRNGLNPIQLTAGNDILKKCIQTAPVDDEMKRVAISADDFSYDDECKKLANEMREFIVAYEKDDCDPHFFEDHLTKQLTPADFGTAPIKSLLPITLLGRYREAFRLFAEHSRQFAEGKHFLPPHLQSMARELLPFLKHYHNYFSTCAQMQGWLHAHQDITNRKAYREKLRGENSGALIPLVPVYKRANIHSARFAITPLWEQAADNVICANSVPTLMVCEYNRRIQYELLPYKLNLIYLFWQSKGLPITPDFVLRNPQYWRELYVGLRFLFCAIETKKEKRINLMDRMLHYMRECDRVVTQLITSHPRAFEEFRDYQKRGTPWMHAISVRETLEKSLVYRPMMITRARTVCESFCYHETKHLFLGMTPERQHHLAKHHREHRTTLFIQTLQARDFIGSINFVRDCQEQKLDLTDQHPFKTIFTWMIEYAEISISRNMSEINPFWDVTYFDAADFLKRDPHIQKDEKLVERFNTQVTLIRDQLNIASNPLLATLIAIRMNDHGFALKVFMFFKDHMNSRNQYQLAAMLCQHFPGYQVVLNEFLFQNHAQLVPIDDVSKRFFARIVAELNPGTSSPSQAGLFAGSGATAAVSPPSAAAGTGDLTLVLRLR